MMSLEMTSCFGMNLWKLTLSLHKTLYFLQHHKKHKTRNTRTLTHTTENSASTSIPSHQSHDSGSSSLPEKKLVSTRFNTHTNNKLHHWTGSLPRRRPPAGLCLDSLSEVLSREHALSPPQDGVLGGIVGMLFGRDLQHGRDGLHVRVNGVTDHLGNELVDQDDANVVPRQEAPDG